MPVSSSYYPQEICNFVSAENCLSGITSLVNFQSTKQEVTLTKEARSRKFCTDKGLNGTLVQLLEKFDLQDILFMLFTYADEQARLAHKNQNSQEKLKWNKLAEMLDLACEALEEDDLDDSYCLIY